MTAFIASLATDGYADEHTELPTGNEQER